MKAFAVRAAVAGMALAAVAAPAAAQGTAARPAATAAATPRSAALPTPVFAIIDTSVFPVQVGEMKAAIDRLNAQFEPQYKELQALRDRMTALESQARQGTATAQQQEQMATQYEQLKREFERKGQDLKDASQRAYQEATAPILRKMSDSLKQFAQRRGITLVLEINAALRDNTLFYAAETSNITMAFVDEYNKANPPR